MTDHAWSGERRVPIAPDAPSHHGNRAHAGAHRTATYAAFALARHNHFEAIVEAAQFEREAAFIAQVNALGGMPRTEIINGYPVAVNGAGVPWRMAEGA